MSDKKAHFIGVGGVGMAGLAVLMKAHGWEVSGCDLKPTDRTRWLESQGVRVWFGHSPEHLTGIDEVVVTPAVSVDEPEFKAAKNVRYRGEVLADLVNASDGIAVCGSHGKTTTSTWTAKLLRALGEDVSWCIGGETGEFPVACAGNGPLVVEADESDGTLALYHAKTLVVNKCEYDHPDHFKTEADYFACYDEARRNAEDVIESENLLDIEALCRANWFAALPEHNRKNARAAVEVALRRGHSLDAVMREMPAVVAELPDRRFQIVWPVSSDVARPLISCSGFTVITDYAHHPTEMRCAVQMARQVCRGRLRVLFQPHRYSRTKALLKDFPASFEGADEVVLCPTYAAFEHPVEGGDIADLYAECRSRRDVSKRVFLCQSCDEAWEHARNSMVPGDVTLLLGAGDIINLVPRIQAELKSGASASAVLRRIWIGAGTNTWKSDLNLDVVYERSNGPADAPGAVLRIPWMVGIPGTVGGWVKMNAGAFGHSISEVISRVKVDGVWRDATDCGFAYRHSNIDGEIQDVEWDSVALERALAEYTADEFLSKRKRFPAGTYGSFFKNPEGDSAGRLLELSGAKSLRVGGAFVWSEHANVIVRGADATGSDVLALARLMHNRVLFRFGISLEPEVCGIRV